MMWGARDAGRRGLKLAVNSFGINVRGRVGHFCQLVGSFLRNVRRGCGRNSDDLFGVEDLRKCRLQRRGHGSFEIEETAESVMSLCFEHLVAHFTLKNYCIRGLRLLLPHIAAVR